MNRFWFYGKVNESGLKEPWAGLPVDLITKDRKGYEEYSSAINEAVVSINSMCSAGFNEIPDNYLSDVLREMESRVNAIDRKLTSNRVQARQFKEKQESIPK